MKYIVRSGEWPRHFRGDGRRRARPRRHGLTALAGAEKRGGGIRGQRAGVAARPRGGHCGPQGKLPLLGHVAPQPPCRRRGGADQGEGGQRYCLAG